MALTKAERNGLMKSLLTGGLKVGDCTLSELKERLTSKLVPTYQIMHKPTGSQFDLYGPVGDFCWQGRMQAGTGPWAH